MFFPGFGFFGASSWRPSAISGLYAAYHADSAPYTGGNKIGRWWDDSGNQRSLYATGSTRALSYAGGDMVGDGTRRIQAVTPGDWKKLHDGTGVTVAVIAQYSGAGTTQAVFGTGTTGAVGTYLSLDGTNNRAVFQIRNGGGAIFTYTGGAGSLTANTNVLFVFRYDLANTPDVDVYLNGASVATGNAASPAATDPTGALRLFALGNDGSMLTGRIRKFAMWNRALTDAEIAIVHANFSNWATSRTRKVVWCIGESTTTSANYPDRFNDRCGDDARYYLTSVGDAPAWSRYTLPLTQNSGYTGLNLDELATALASDTVSSSSGVTDAILMTGINEAIDFDLTDAGIRATSQAKLVSLMQTVEGRTPGATRYLVTPNLSTSGTTGPRITAWNAELGAIAAARGWTYVDLMAGGHALVGGDISGDTIHPTTSTAPAPPNADAGYDKIGETIADSFGFAA